MNGIDLEPLLTEILSLVATNKDERDEIANLPVVSAARVVLELETARLALQRASEALRRR